MILRIWHGWTAPEDADAYEELLTTEIFPDIAERANDGYLGYTVGRHEGDEEVEFVTVMRFESMVDIESFVGEDVERAHVPDAARELLARWDDRVTHYEVRDETGY